MRRSTDEGWMAPSCNGSISMRPSASALRIDTSERITEPDPISAMRLRRLDCGDRRVGGAPCREAGALGEAHHLGNLAGVLEEERGDGTGIRRAVLIAEVEHLLVDAAVARAIA